MAFNNRVDPFGAVHGVPARGLFTGNRGSLHDPATATLTRRRWTTRAWICCALEWRGRRRQPMGVNTQSGGAGWTALFFLDEVTALAAGHRPCFTCRRLAAKQFLAASGEPSLRALDARLHGERRAAGAPLRPLRREALAGLPDGAMVAAGAAAFAMRGGVALPWSFDGYGAPIALGQLPEDGLSLLTPSPALAVLAASYCPIWHASAGP